MSAVVVYCKWTLNQDDDDDDDDDGNHHLFDIYLCLHCTSSSVHNGTIVLGLSSAEKCIGCHFHIYSCEDGDDLTG